MQPKPTGDAQLGRPRPGVQQCLQRAWGTPAHRRECEGLHSLTGCSSSWGHWGYSHRNVPGTAQTLPVPICGTNNQWAYAPGPFPKHWAGIKRDFSPLCSFHLDKMCCSYQNGEGKKIPVGKMPRAREWQRITLAFEVVREWQKEKDLHTEGV